MGAKLKSGTGLQSLMSGAEKWVFHRAVRGYGRFFRKCLVWFIVLSLVNPAQMAGARAVPAEASSSSSSCYFTIMVAISAGWLPLCPGCLVPCPIGDPVSGASGAYYRVWNLLDLGGPMDLNYTLYYLPELSIHFPVNLALKPDRDVSGMFFSSLNMEIMEIENTTDGSRSVHVLLGNREEVLDYDADSDTWMHTGSDPYQLKVENGYYYLADQKRERVYIFEPSNNTFADVQGYSSAGWGRIRAIMDRNGNSLSFSYDSRGHVSQVTDGLGRTITLAYSAVYPYPLETVSDGYGRSISFDSGACTFSSITGVDGSTTVFETDPERPCYIASETKPEGNTVMEQTFTDNNNSDWYSSVASQDDAYSNRTDFTYSQSPDGSDITRIDYPDGSTQTFVHANSRYPASRTDQAGNTFSIEYNTRYQPVRVTDRSGRTSSYTYDGTSGEVASFTNANGHTVSYSYTAQTQTFTNPDNDDTVDFIFYKPSRINYPDSTHAEFTYDNCGNRLTYKDIAGKTWAWTYNSMGQVLTMTNPRNGVITNTYNLDGTLSGNTDSDADTGVTTYTYDDYKRLKRIKKPDGGTVQITYNSKDQITAVTDENNHTTTYAYDDNGNLITVTDPTGNVTRHTYDLMDRITGITDRNGKTAGTTYDVMGRASRQTDPTGVSVAYGYDQRGWENSLTIGSGTWRFSHNADGELTGVTTPLGNTASLTRDSLGNVISSTNGENETTRLTRDAMTRVTTVKDPLNNTTTYTYGSDGNLGSRTLPDGSTVSFTYDSAGNMSKLTDLNGKDWRFSFSAMGRLSTRTDPLNNREQYTYDSNGLTDQVTYPDGVTRTAGYDSAGNLTGLTYSDGVSKTFTYDELGWMDSASGISFTHDREGRITDTGNGDTTFGATYDDAGRLKTVTYNNNAFTVTYAYDSGTGMLSSVSDSLTGTQVGLTYDGDSRLAAIDRSTVDTTFTYDKANRITRIQDGSIIDLKYTLDKAGRIVSAETTVPLEPGSLLTDSSRVLTVDDASQISTTGYSYDARGRQTAAGSDTFTWDGASRLTGINSAAMTYNGLDDLVTRSDGTGTIHYHYNYAIDRNPMVAEQDDGTENFLRYYIWTPDGRLLYMIDAENGNKVYHFHADSTGSVLALTSGQTGSVVDSYAYTPYGKLLGHDGTSEQPFTYVGIWGVHQISADGPYYNMKARTYDAGTGRFLSRDPLWPSGDDPIDVNPYVYAKTDPIQIIDPEGEIGFFAVVGLVLLATAIYKGGKKIIEVVNQASDNAKNAKTPEDVIKAKKYADRHSVTTSTIPAKLYVKRVSGKVGIVNKLCTGEDPFSYDDESDDGDYDNSYEYNDD